MFLDHKLKEVEEKASKRDVFSTLFGSTRKKNDSMQALLTASEGPDGPLALQLFAAIVMGVAGGKPGEGAGQQWQTRPPAEAVRHVLPPGDPERPFSRLCTLMQVCHCSRTLLSVLRVRMARHAPRT